MLLVGQEVVSGIKMAILTSILSLELQQLGVELEEYVKGA